MIILSILIPTIPERSNMFTTLFNEVYRQISYLNTTHPTLGKVEVLIDDSPKFLDGGLSIGKKREALLKRAEGQYLCYLDDDETIAPNYVETLVRLCEANRDVVTFRNLTKTETYWTIIDMSLKYTVNDQASPDFITRRRPWHICPVKSHLAKKYTFLDSNYGEDFEWMNQVLKNCTTEAHTDAVLHIYNHGKHSESDKITAHELFTK
jgi:glycosyltransferase involved in cell wall biosynthesis